MRVLTTSQTAKALGVSVSTVSRLIKAGDLKAYRVTPVGRQRVREEDLIKFAEERNIKLNLQPE